MTDWHKLTHAYGSAEDIPALLAALSDFPSESSYYNEPWFSLWSALCHQGDIYSASIAAVPEIIRILGACPERATFCFFVLPASIESARVKGSVEVPAELSSAYFEAIKALGGLALRACQGASDDLVRRGALAAFATSIGQQAYAEVILEIPADDAPDVVEWYMQR